eukprot:3686231-Rhodomonas_salina.2
MTVAVTAAAWPQFDSEPSRGQGKIISSTPRRLVRVTVTGSVRYRVTQGQRPCRRVPLRPVSVRSAHCGRCFKQGRRWGHGAWQPSDQRHCQLAAAAAA